MPLFKQSPEDFVVEEIPAYSPQGQGEHLYVTFRKRMLTSDQAVRRLAEALGAPQNECGVAGLKDKVGVTTQTVSLPLGPKRSVAEAEALLRAVEDESLQIQALSPHPHKLRTGHLRGNRFSLWVRGVSLAEAALCQTQLERGREHGIPNSFGDQRFGRFGDNATRALAMIRGEAKPSRDPRQRRFLFSAFQSLLFNELLAERVADGSYGVPADGELVMRHRQVQGDEDERGAMFLVKPEELADTQARALAREVSPTGPLWGAKMRKPSGAALDRELAALAAHGLDEAALAPFARLGEGARRSLRLFAEDLTVELVAKHGGADADEADIQLRFVLPKGAYATEVLAWAFPGGVTEAAPHLPPTPSSRTLP